MAAMLATDISAHGNLIRSKSDTAINESNTRTVARTTSAKILEKSLLLKKDLVLDFTSLKSCIDPLSETAAGKDTESGFEQVSIAYAGNQWVGLITSPSYKKISEQSSDLIGVLPVFFLCSLITRVLFTTVLRMGINFLCLSPW